MNTTKNNSESKTSSHEKYIAFLKEKIKDDNQFFWDYDDELSVDSLATIVKKMFKEKKENENQYISFMPLLEEHILQEYSFYMEDALKNTIESDLPNQSEEIIDEYHHSDDFFADLEEAGFKGFDMNLKTLMNQSKFYINIMLALPDEENFNMTSITNLFGNKYTAPCGGYEDKDEKTLNNALVYLIHQQGFTVSRVLRELKANKAIDYFHDTFNFPESVRKEIINNPNYLTHLTVLLCLTGADIGNFFEFYVNGGINLQIGTSANFGLFNDIDGGGSLFEINLKKPFIMPKDIIKDIQIEGISRNYSYGVQSVYDMDWNVWSSDFTFTNEKPVLRKELKENIDKTYEKLFK